MFRKSSHHNKVKPWDVPRKNYYYKYDLHDEAEDNDSWREEEEQETRTVNYMTRQEI